jgi:uncharacterized protein YdaU (DUF1376 family)
VAELYWFPAFVADWLGSSAISMMLPEQEGAYWRLLNLAWGNGAVEPSLPDDDDALAQMSRLGKRWAKLGPLVRAQFKSRGGRLYNAKLSGVWHDQQEKHEKAVVRASAGGKAKAAKRRTKNPATSSAQAVLQAEKQGAQSSASGSAQAVLGECLTAANLELEEAVQSPLQGFVLASAPENGALALEGARAAGAEGEGNSTDESPYADSHDWKSLLESAFPQESAARRVRQRAEHDVAQATIWYAEHPESHNAIAAELAAFPVNTDAGRERMRVALIVAAWREAGAPIALVNVPDG